MYRFFQEKRGEVDRRIILIAAIMIIALFFFLRLKETVRCEHNKTVSRMTLVLFTNNNHNITEVEDCEVGGVPENPGSIVPPGDIPNPSYPYNPDSPYNPDTPYNPGAPGIQSYFSETGLSLTCNNVYAPHNFNIPSSTPNQGMGTQKVTLSNKKGWDIWIRVTDVQGLNGLKPSLTKTPYYQVKDGETVEFQIPWHWDVDFDYKGARGKGSIQFHLACEEPSETQDLGLGPDGIRTFKVKETKYNALTLEWDKVPYATSYKVYSKDSKGATKLIQETNGSQLQVLGLSPNTEYKYVLEAYNAHGRTYRDLTAKTSLSNLRPKKPENFNVTSTTTSTATMSWKAVPEADYYTIRLKDVEIWRGTDTSFVAGKLMSGTEHTFGLRAHNEYGTSDHTLAIGVTKGTSPLPVNPSKMWIESTTETTITLKWEPIPGVTRYALNLYDKFNPYTTSTTYTVTGLTPGTEYYFYMRGQNGHGYSPERANVKGMTKGVNPIPKKPSNVKITDIGNNEMTLQWDTVPGVDGYFVKLPDGTNKPVTTNYYRVTKLPQNKQQTLYVASVSGEYVSEWASQSAKTTNKLYDSEEVIESKCSNDTIENVFELPLNIERGQSGTVEVNIENPLNRNLHAKMLVEREGDIFNGFTPAQIFYDRNWVTINPKETGKLSIRWTLPLGADKSYEGKTGKLIASVSLRCGE